MRLSLMLIALVFACSAAVLAAGAMDSPAGTGAGAAMDTDVETFHQVFVVQYYAIPQSEIVALRNQGYSWEQIYMMANAAVRTNQPISQIAQLRSQGMTWNQIADRYNVPVADLTRPTQLRTVTTTRPLVGAGPMTPMYVYDRMGNIILTEDDAIRYYSMGFDWVDVAVASNISRETGIPVSRVLSEMRTTPLTPNDVIDRYGISPEVAFNIEGYPFPRMTRSESMTERKFRAIERYQKPGGCITMPPARMAIPETIPQTNP